MTVIDFLKFIETNPFLVYYYAFSMLMSVLLGVLFLRHMGYQRLWNYFFSILIHMMSIIGVFSLVITVFQLATREYQMHPLEMLIPFFTLLIGILILSKRINLGLITGYKHFWSYYALVTILITLMFFLNDVNWVKVAQWPLSWVLILLLVLLLIFQKMPKWIYLRNA